MTLRFLFWCSLLLASGSLMAQSFPHEVSELIIPPSTQAGEEGDLVYGETNYRVTADPLVDLNGERGVDVYFLKEDKYYDGFLIIGHAQAAACRVASREIVNSIQELGQTADNWYTFGFGMHRRNQRQNRNNYHKAMQTMRSNLEALAKRFPAEVRVADMSTLWYDETQKNYVDRIRQSRAHRDWTVHQVAYKHVPYPLVVPYLAANSAQPITLDIPLSLIGSVPTDLVYKSLQAELDTL